MPENVNTSELVLNQDAEPEDNRPVMIKVDHVSMSFNMASEQMNSLKEYAVAIAKRKLFFEEFKALDDVSFEVRKGDVFGIMGTNGSGKSTMLKIIAGVLEPTKGTCQVNGNIAPLIELGAGFDMDLSARENIYLNGALLGYSKQFIDENFDAIVEFAEVEKFLDMPLKNYSSGMVARIAFAIATVIVPEILVVDEVLSVGDFMFQKKCEDRITELIERHGVTVLIVSHSNEQIARLCNRAIWIEKGHERLQGDAGDVSRFYAGLAGRMGTPAAEERLFASLQECRDPSAVRANVSHIVSDNPDEVPAILVDNFWPEDASQVVLSCKEDPANMLYAHSFAGLVGAPVLPCLSAYLPEYIGRLLHRWKPETIVLFDCAACATGLSGELGRLTWGPEVIVVAPHGDTCMSEQTYLLGLEYGGWNSSLLAVPLSEEASCLTAATIAWKEKMPIVVLETVKQPDGAGALLGRRNWHSIVVCSADDAWIAKVKELAPKMQPIKLEGIDELDACLMAGLDIARRQTPAAKNSGKRRLVVVRYPIVGGNEYGSCGCCCAVTDSILLFVNPANLDSVKVGLDFINEFYDSIGSICFIGRSNDIPSLYEDIYSVALGKMKSEALLRQGEA